MSALGYTLDEIKGRHHSMFMPPETRETPEYRAFWASLARGEFQQGEFRRIGKGGRDVWISASYIPIADLSGRPRKVVKFAIDVTEQVTTRKFVEDTVNASAAGVEELNASIREIAANMAHSRNVAVDAVNKVRSADASTRDLMAARDSMTSVIELINKITAQINLLALNATIESARAGEAGRGFAVVANEVKTLAGQARTATDRIAGEIQRMSEVSETVAGALSAIDAAVDDVAQYVTSTSAAVEQQSAVTRDIAESMQRLSERSNRSKRVG